MPYKPRSDRGQKGGQGSGSSSSWDKIKQTIKTRPGKRQQHEVKVAKAPLRPRQLMASGTFPSTKDVVAIDCEMVGTGPEGKDSILARASIVNYFGKVLLDALVRPTKKVTDYRTQVTGLDEATLNRLGQSAEEVKEKAASILLNQKVVVGHAIHHDLDILDLTGKIDPILIRDTSTYPGLRPENLTTKVPSLKKLTELHLDRKIQTGTHSSVEDARCTLMLYKLKKDEWEEEVRKTYRIRVHKPKEALNKEEVAKVVPSREVKPKKRRLSVDDDDEVVKEEEEEKADDDEEEEEVGSEGSIIEERAGVADLGESAEEVAKICGKNSNEEAEILAAFADLANMREEFAFQKPKANKKKRKQQA
ncbi:RNA exonuclease, putative [Perkinsus marinus ATCC 50983]|uniref:RNA exonuclease 4 n=1 Tax=Perkinsus marinus (strain ATCC 50983 / TXsc) TaxID=423536 RepID=C5L3L2_PERM5|nr:RNA exonuclease, putative [Perkinsus marinus ATCC 50983]EER08591.1 RNA exonuclease, putative [Perkinsus marinus ATCC 50983]|eukprot:XP_002776775.1 RNA exonuclease, putative [Perkinsus marinus ATCC 50983]